MIRALVSGILYGDPVVRTSQAGKSYVTAKVKADGKDGVAVWCSVAAFGDQADRLAMLRANAAVSVSGKAELSAWSNKQGEPTAGISVVADEVAALKGKVIGQKKATRLRH
jgi:single-stranded DNA-binding protein